MNKVSEYRSKAGFTKEQLGEMTELFWDIDLIESGKKKLSIRDGIKIAKALGIHPGHLLYTNIKEC